MTAALRRALALARQPDLWAGLQRRAMTRDFSWRRPADEYDAIYAAAREKVRAAGAPTLVSVRDLLEVHGR